METSTFSDYKYYAFISYQRKDEKWAQWLQKQLEHYKLPVNISRQHPNIPQSLRPVFKDTTDLSGAKLKESLSQALTSSKYLVVICSPSSSKSKWVNNEAQYFIDNNREDCIIPFIVGGTPFSDDVSIECFPESIRQLRGERELLGININENGREAAVVKVVSRMTGLDFDTLWQRYSREQRLHRNIKMLLVSIIAICAIVIALVLYRQNILINSQKDQLLITQSIAVSDAANRLVGSGDAYTATMLALEVLPKDVSNPDRPLTHEAEYALRNATSQKGGYLKGHTDRVYDAKVSHNGEFVVSGSCDNSIKIWSVNNGVCVKTLLGHNDRVYMVDISKDDQFILSVSDIDNIMKVWNIETGECINTIDFKALGNICYAKFSDDGHKITTFIGKSVLVWDVDSGDYSVLYEDIVPHPISSSYYCHIDSKYIVIQYSEGRVGIWDIDKQRMKTTKFINFLSDIMVYDNRLIEVVSSFTNPYSSIKVYNLEDDTEILNIPTSKNFSIGAISPNGKHLVTASNVVMHGRKSYPSIDVWDLESKKCVKTFTGHLVESVSFSPCGRYVISSGLDDVVGLWCIENGLPDTIIDSEANIKWTDDCLVCYTIGKELNIYDIEREQIIFCCEIDAHNVLNSYFRVYDINHNKQYVFTKVNQLFPNISEIYNYPIVVYDIVNNITKSFELDYAEEENVSFTADDIILTKDNKYLIASFSSTTCYGTMEKTEGWSFSSSVETIIVWDFSTGERLHTLSKSEYQYLRIMDNEQSRLLYLLPKDGLGKVWNIDTGESYEMAENSYTITTMIQLPSNSELIFSYKTDNESKGMCLYNTITRKYNTILEDEDGYFACITISNNKEFYIVESPNRIDLLSTNDHSIIESYSLENDIQSIKLSNNDRYLAILDSSGDVSIYDLKNNGLIDRIEVEGLNIAFCNNGEQILIDNQIYDITPLQVLINNTREQFKDRVLTSEECKMYYLE